MGRLVPTNLEPSSSAVAAPIEAMQASPSSPESGLKSAACSSTVRFGMGGGEGTSLRTLGKPAAAGATDDTAPPSLPLNHLAQNGAAARAIDRFVGSVARRRSAGRPSVDFGCGGLCDEAFEGGGAHGALPGQGRVSRLGTSATTAAHTDGVAAARAMGR
jgi:hypothetical protein